MTIFTYNYNIPNYYKLFKLLEHYLNLINQINYDLLNITLI